MSSVLAKKLLPLSGLAALGVGSTMLADAGVKKDSQWQPAFPASERPRALFNGQNLDQFDLQGPGKFVVVDGEIIGRTDQKRFAQRRATVVQQANLLSSDAKSVNLLSREEFRNFRLTFEGRLGSSDPAKVLSGVSFWGKTFKMPTKEVGTYEGSLACCMPKPGSFYELCEQDEEAGSRGYWLRKNKSGNSQSQSQSFDKFELLVTGDRVQMAVNGKVAMDWVDPDPEFRQKGPIGLQLHWDKAHAQVHWRNLLVSDNPSDKLITVG